MTTGKHSSAFSSSMGYPSFRDILSSMGSSSNVEEHGGQGVPEDGYPMEEDSKIYCPNTTRNAIYEQI